MAYPEKPSIQTSYTAVEQALGDGSLPGQELDVDFANLKLSLDALNDFVRGVTRSDGRLANRSVSRETLGPDISLGFDTPTTWAPDTNYTPPQTVFESDKFYLCVIEHTSSADFATDFAASRWEVLVDFAAVLAGSVAAKDDAEAALAEFRTRYIGAAAADPSLDPAGGALIDGALYWNIGAARLKVYDLATTAWYFVSPTPAEQTAVNTVAGIAADVTSVVGNAADISTVAGGIADVATVAGISGDVSAVAANNADVSTVAGITADISTVAGVAADVSIAAANVADITNFADVYQGPAASDPTTRTDSSPLQVGDLYFNTVAENLRVYDGANWVVIDTPTLGTAAVEDVGTAIGDVVQLEDVGGNPGLPAVDGSQLTGIAFNADDISYDNTISGLAATDVQDAIDELEAQNTANPARVRAWVNFDGTTTTPTIRASHNVSSVVRNATGDYTVNFTSALPDANYAASALSITQVTSTIGNYTSSFAEINIRTVAGSPLNTGNIFFIVVR